MSDIGTDPLPEDVASLLADAKTLTGPSDAVRARMRDKLVAALPPPGGGGGGAATGSSGAGGFSLPRVPAWVAAATFAAGLAAGALVRPSAPPPLPEVAKTTDVAHTTPSAPAGQVVPTVLPSDLPLVAAVSATAPPPGPASAAPAPSAHAARGSDLAAERALLDMARTALAKGDNAGAYGAAEDHEKRFPRGALAEEREAIAVRALAEGGKKDAARSRAERFKKTHPESILLPAVLAAGGVE